MEENSGIEEELRELLQAGDGEESAPEEVAEPQENEGQGESAAADASAETDSGQAETKSAPPVGEDPPPSTWSAAGKAVYASLPPEARAEISKREKDVARGIQQYAERSRYAEAIQNEFRPYEAMFRSIGANEFDFVRNALSVEYKLRTGTPQERGQLLLQYAKHYGADLGQLTDEPLQDSGLDYNALNRAVQSQVAPYINKMQRWEMEQQAAVNRAKQAEQHEAISQIEAFRNERDQDNNVAHVYFDNVRDDMAALLAAGRCSNIKQAYEMACRANPEVYAAMQAEQQRKAEAERLKDERARTAKAKRAGFSVSSGAEITGQSAPMTLEQELSALMQGARI